MLNVECKFGSLSSVQRCLSVATASHSAGIWQWSSVLSSQLKDVDKNTFRRWKDVDAPEKRSGAGRPQKLSSAE
eukprot:2756921-Amphidinium_carterae.1